MLDEEAGYGFSVNSLIALNHYVESVMINTPGMSWYFTENFPRARSGDWTLAQYNAILSTSWPAPQVYNSFMVGFVNSSCSVYHDCTNLVTINSRLAGNWHSPSWVTAQINEFPWPDFGNWCGCNWYNVWRPQ
jgi:hypothetical protein